MITHALAVTLKNYRSTVMKSVRLSTFLRKEILTSVLNEFTLNHLEGHGFLTSGDLAKAIAKESQFVAKTLWLRAYGNINFKGVPSWALNKSNKFSASVIDDSSLLFQTFVYEEEDQLAGKRLPCRSAVDIVISMEEWTELFKKKAELKEISANHEAERHQLLREVQPVLDSFGTTKQLLETWPSMEKFIPANIADPDRGIRLPAISLSRLEAKINGKG